MPERDPPAADADAGAPRGGKGRGLVARIGAVTAVVVALALLLLNVNKVVREVKGLGAELGLVKAYCDSVDVEVHTFDSVPYSLNYTMKARHYQQRRDPYWFLLEAHNRCWWDDVAIKVRFDLVRGGEYATIKNPELPTIELPAGESIARTDDPHLFFTAASARSEGLEVSWQVFPHDDPATILKTGSRAFSVLPRETFPWDWTDGNQRRAQWWVRRAAAAPAEEPSYALEPVPDEFIVASLTAWTVDLHDAVLDTTDRVRDRVRLAHPEAVDHAYVGQVVETAYRMLFHGAPAPRLRVTRSRVDFPQRRAVSLPSQLLEGAPRTTRSVDALEAALALGAVVRELFEGSRFGLAFVPAAGAPLRKAVYFVWWEHGDDARALDLGAAAQPFADNAASATAALAAALGPLAARIESLRADGVDYVDAESPITIDVLGAIDHHDIRRIR